MRRVVAAAAWPLFLLAAAAPAGADGLATSASLGLSLARGNTETVLVNAGVTSEGERKGLGALRLGVEAAYGETVLDGRTEVTTRNAKGFAAVRRDLSPAVFAYADAAVLHDRVAGIDYRATLGPGAGVFLFRDDATRASVEVGLSYVLEDGVRTDDYAAFRAAERVEHAFGPGARVWQSAEYLPRIGDAGDYLLGAELGAEAALGARLSLRVVLQDRYVGRPGEGLEHNDLSLVAGVRVKL